ncbi:MAG: choice-of-anchor X domain-containing protein [Myxococcota bacterium]|jgi:hypothetical protein
MEARNRWAWAASLLLACGPSEPVVGPGVATDGASLDAAGEVSAVDADAAPRSDVSNGDSETTELPDDAALPDTDAETETHPPDADAAEPEDAWVWTDGDAPEFVVPDGYEVLEPFDAFATDAFPFEVAQPDVTPGDLGPCGGAGSCDDGQWCNGAETCVAGQCQAGKPPCVDENPATFDTCQEAGQKCAHDHPPWVLVADVVVKVGKEATLDASGSGDDDGDFLDAFEWVLMDAPNGAQAILQLDGGPHANLTPDVVGIYSVGVIAKAKGLWSPPKLVRVFAVEQLLAWMDATKTTRSVGEMVLAGGLNACVQFNQFITGNQMQLQAVTTNPQVAFVSSGAASSGAQVCGAFKPSQGRLTQLAVGDSIGVLGSAQGKETGDTLNFATNFTVTQGPGPDPGGPLITAAETDAAYYPGLAGKVTVKLQDTDGDVSAELSFLDYAFLSVEPKCGGLLAAGGGFQGYDDGSHGDMTAGDGVWTFALKPSGSLKQSGLKACHYDAAVRVYDTKFNRSQIAVFTVTVEI